MVCILVSCYFVDTNSSSVILADARVKMQLAREDFEDAVADLPLALRRSRPGKSTAVARRENSGIDEYSDDIDGLCTSDEEMMMDELGRDYWPHESSDYEGLDDSSSIAEIPETRNGTPVVEHSYNPVRFPLPGRVSAHFPTAPIPASASSTVNVHPFPSLPYRVLPGPEWPMDFDALDSNKMKVHRNHLLSVFGPNGLPCLLADCQHSGNGVIVCKFVPFLHGCGSRC